MKFLTFLFLFVLCSVQLQAATILVPSEQPTIQAGIDVASEGDTVLVAPGGIYSGDGNRDLTFNGVNLVLKSASEYSLVRISCGGNSLNPHIFVELTASEDSTSMIKGFSIQGAYASGGSKGAITFNGGVANIESCWIENNSANGISSFVSGTESRILYCKINKNRTGIYSNQTNLVVDICEINSNEFNGIEYDANIKISNSIIARNLGTGIKHANGTGAQFEIDHCTIVYNNLGMIYEYIPPMPGGKEFSQQLYTTTISNSIVAFNTDGGIFNNFFGDTHYNSVFCNVFGNGNYNWQNDKYTHGDEFGNLSLDPIFCYKLTDNFNLQDHSPCAAINNASGSTIGLFDTGCGCCIGMRGNVDGDPNDQVDISDLVLMVDCIFADCVQACHEELDMNASGAEDISDLVFIVDFIFLGGPEPLPCYE